MARTLGGGDIAFLPGHAPFIGALDTWTVDIRPVDGRVDSGRRSRRVHLHQPTTT